METGIKDPNHVRIMRSENFAAKVCALKTSGHSFFVQFWKQQGRAFGPALLTHSTFREQNLTSARRRSFTPANLHTKTVWLLHFCTEDATLPEPLSPASHQNW